MESFQLLRGLYGFSQKYNRIFKTIKPPLILNVNIYEAFQFRYYFQICKIIFHI